MNQEKEIDSLNKLLLGENMAVNSFNVFISKIKEKEVKKVFQEVQDKHRENIKNLADYIQNHGSQAKENIGLKGKMANMKVGRELGDEADVEKILKEAINGEKQGINMAEKVLRGKLDDKTRQLAGDVLHNDRMSLDRLRGISVNVM